GRAFEQSDAGTGGLGMILSSALARQLLPGEDPVGRQIDMGDAGKYTVIGVVGDVRNQGLAGPPEPEFYLDRDQSPRMWIQGATSRHIVAIVRGDLSPALLETLLRSEIHALAPTVPVEVSTLRERVGTF